MSSLSPLDWLILIVTSGLTFIVIIYGHRCKKDPSKTDYLLMGRQLTLPLFIATLTATWYGGIMGVTQIAFREGIYNFFTQGVFWYFTYIIFALVIVKKIRSYKVNTLPELVRKLYGNKSASLTAIFIFFKTLPISYAISIGLLIQLFIPVKLYVATSIGVGVVALYSATGGLRAIVYSNVVQFILMCIGLASVFIYSVCNFGGLNFLHAKLPAQHFEICGSKSISTTLVWLFIACSATFINPAFYQRCFAARSNKTASIGILISTCIWIIFDICTTFGAMYARALIPEADPTHAYITYGIQLLPNGLRGLFIASILATILSTLDSFLFITSNTLYYDVQLFKNRSPYLAVTITAIATIGLSFFFDGNIEKVWFLFKSYFSACLLVPILIGYFVRSSLHDNVFLMSGLCSCMAMTICNFYNTTFDSFYVGCIVSSFTFLLYSGYTQYNTYRAQTANNLR